MKTRFLALAAMVLGLASCQQEFNGVTPLEGEVDFQLGVSAPELITRAGDKENAPQNAWDSAYGAIDYLQALAATSSNDYRVDWTEVDLRYTLEVYDYDKADNYAGATPVKDRQVIIVDEYQPVTFDLRLIPNRDYHFVVFADFVKQDATVESADDTITLVEHQADLGLHHYIDGTLQNITIKKDAINDECTDAYFATRDITITNSAANGMELKRPYGKVRVIATDLAELNLNVNPTKVEVKYYAKHPQTFNAVTGAIGAEVEEVYTLLSTYNEGVCKESLANHFYTAGYDSMTAKNANNETRHTHMTLFTDYILAGDEQSPISFDMTVYEGDEVIKFTEFSTMIPVQRNHLTTIIGNVLTTATQIDVTIDDNFAGEHVVYAEDYVIDETTNTLYAYNADGLLKWSWLSNVAGKNMNLVLMSDVTFPMFTVEEDAANETYKYTNTPITFTNGLPDGSNWVQVGTWQPVVNILNDLHIDGNGKTLRNLAMTSDNLIVGFIGRCLNTEVKDLTFDNATIHSTGSYVAPLSYFDDGSYIHNVHVKNSYISGNSNVGGIVAELMDHYDDQDKPYVLEFEAGTRKKLMPIATIENCSTDSNTKVVGTGSQIGGIISQAYGSLILDCHNSANVSGSEQVGGIAGYIRDYHYGQYGYIVNCTSTNCNITASTKIAGGIAGYVMEGHDGSVWVVRCFSNSTINCPKTTGSIVGYLQGDNKILGNYGISEYAVSGNNLAGNFSFSFASDADMTAEAKAKMNEGIAEYNAFAANYSFPTTIVCAKPMDLPTATNW